MTIPPKFALFECANMDYLIRDIENKRFLNRKEEVELLNDLSATNEHLCNKIRELEKENWKLKKNIDIGCNRL